MARPIPDDPCRAAFEDWCDSKPFYNLHQTEPGKYWSYHTENAWQMWQEAWKAGQAAVATKPKPKGKKS